MGKKYQYSADFSLNISQAQKALDLIKKQIKGVSSGSEMKIGLENQVAAISKTIEKLTTLTKKGVFNEAELKQVYSGFNSIGQLINSLGESMGELTFEDFDISAFSAETVKRLTEAKNAVIEIDNEFKQAKQSLEAMVSPEKIKALKEALKGTKAKTVDFGENGENFSVEGLIEQNKKLTENIELLKARQQLLEQVNDVEVDGEKGNARRKFNDTRSSAYVDKIMENMRKGIMDNKDAIFKTGDLTTEKATINAKDGGKNKLKEILMNSVGDILTAVGPESPLGQEISKMISDSLTGPKLLEMLQNESSELGQKIRQALMNAVNSVGGESGKGALTQSGTGDRLGKNIQTQTVYTKAIQDAQAAENKLVDAANKRAEAMNKYDAEKGAAVEEKRVKDTEALANGLHAVSNGGKAAGDGVNALTNAEGFSEMNQLLENIVQKFFSLSSIINMVKRGISSMISTIKDLDTQMTEIAVVTDMTTADLWDQIDTYSSLAQTYGTTIKGAYQVSTLYYQQGLQTNDVLAATAETLKFARVSGMEYAEATDAMTVAKIMVTINYLNCWKILKFISLKRNESRKK